MKNRTIPNASNIPIIGSTLKIIGKDPRDFLLKQHHKLGPIFRLKVMHLNYVVIAGEKANQFAGKEGINVLESKTAAYTNRYLQRNEKKSHINISSLNHTHVC